MKLLFYVMIVMMIIPSAFAEGFTVSSVSYVKNIAHDSNITMELIIDGGGQSVSGIWMGVGLPDNVSLSRPLKIEVKNNTEKLIYPFINQNTLYKYHAYYVDSYKDESAQCPPRPAFCYPVNIDYVYTWNHKIVSIMIKRLIVVERQAIGSYSSFGNPDISQNIELGITVGDNEYRQTIGTGQDSRGTAVFRTNENEWLANAHYTGMSMTGRGSPNQNLYIGTHENGKEWRISPKVYYDNYVKSLTATDIRLALWQNELQDNWDRIGTDLPRGEIESTACKDALCSDVINAVNLHNAEVEKLLSQNVGIDYSSPMAKQETVIRDGNVYDTLNQPIGNGHVILTLNAEEIGIISLSGKPKIEDVSVTSCVSGDNTCSFLVKIENVGNAKSTFGVRVNGSIEQKITIDSGKSSQLEVLFNVYEGINIGNVEVYDLVSGDSDTKSYQINVSSPKRHIPNDSEVFNNAELKNSEDGMNQTTVKDCPNGIWTRINGAYVCTFIKDIPVPTQPARMQYQIPVPTPAPAQEARSSTIWVIVIVFLAGMVIALLLTGGRSKKGRGVSIGLILLILAIGAVGLVALLYLPAILEKIKGIQFMMNIMDKLR